MQAVTDRQATQADAAGVSTTSPGSLRLLPGVELLGRVEGSALRQAPYYARRPDGQVVQLSGLLFLIAEQAVRGRTVAEIAESVARRLDVRITPEQVDYVLEHKLHPLGLVAARDGSAPPLRRLDPLLGLKFRVGILAPRIVNPVAAFLRPLFAAPVVTIVLAALLAFDVWLFGFHGLDQGVSHLIARPDIGLLLFVLSYASLAFHELGHAAACRYGGGRPGAIGIGVYLVWPVFYTDVTDSYRFGRVGRLRTDLGGVYFNAVFALGLVAAYLATGFEPLLVAVIAQHMLVLNQFLPWVRLDGYYVVADVIGVSDLFSRIGPVLRSLVPGREPEPRVRELKTWARVAVTAWVVSVLVMLTVALTVLALHVSGYLERAWRSLFVHAASLGDAVGGGHVGAFISGSLAVLFLLLPVLALVLTYVFVCRRVGFALARARARATLAAESR